MINSLFLQILLLVNVFAIGILTTIVVRHAYAHYHKQPPKPPQPKKSIAKLPPEVEAKLLKEAQTNFETVMRNSAEELRRDLNTTATQMDEQLKKFSTEVIRGEVERYRQTLEDLRKQAEVAMQTTQATLDHHRLQLDSKLQERQKELEMQLQQSILTERQHLLQQMDTKLSDAVTSFLLDTLGHDVDLGAQQTYLIRMLEEHKAELVKEITSET